MRSGVRSPSAPRRILATVAAAAACNTASPAKDAPHERAAEAGAPLVEGAGTSPGAAAGGSAAPTAPPSAACSADDDCLTWSSYCQDAPCVCRVFAKDEPQPRCRGAGTVTCFADPCMNKAAACQERRCVLVMGATR
ncbi:MAG: hypothetical protein KF782_06255 [Labilithrix sp.]|nr:hypothetical protein [Labilithrix sp.]